MRPSETETEGGIVRVMAKLIESTDQRREYENFELRKLEFHARNGELATIGVGRDVFDIGRSEAEALGKWLIDWAKNKPIEPDDIVVKRERIPGAKKEHIGPKYIVVAVSDGKAWLRSQSAHPDQWSEEIVYPLSLLEHAG